MAGLLGISNPKPENNLIEPDKLGFTTAAGGTAGIVAVLAILTAVSDWLGQVTVNENIKIALIGLAGAGFLAWAIASSADVLARAYAAAHVAKKDTPDTAPKPALEAAAEKLAGSNVSAALSPTPGGAGGGASKSGAGLPTPVALPAELDVLVGRIPARAIAGRLEADGKMSYLVRQKDTMPEWVPEARVTSTA